MGFNLAENEKFIIFSDSLLQLTFMKLPIIFFFFFWCTIKEQYSQLSEKANKYSSLPQIWICVRLDFHVLQPNATILEHTE